MLRVGRGHRTAGLCAESWEGVMGQQVCMLRVGRGHGTAGLHAESGKGSWDSRFVC